MSEIGRKTVNTVFKESCQSNDVRRVAGCILIGVDVNMKFGGGWSALTIAAKNNFVRLIEDVLLEDPKLDINICTSAPGTSYHNNTALIYACEKGNAEIVKKLVSHKSIKIELANSYGITALHTAAWNSSECVKILADVPGLNWNCKDFASWTPLTHALAAGNAEAVESIISQKNFDFSVKNNLGMSYAEVCLSFDADENEGLQCLKLLARVPAIDWNAKLSDNCDGDPPIIYLLKSDQIEKFKFLVRCPNIDLSVKDSNGDGLEEIAMANFQIYVLHLLPRIKDQRMETMDQKLQQALKQMNLSVNVPECPVCYENYPKDCKIYQCINGHHLCGKCKKSLLSKVCPRCNMPICGRAHDFEKILYG